MDSHRSSCSRQSETRPWKPLSRSSFKLPPGSWDEKWDFVNSRRDQTPRPLRRSQCKITTAEFCFLYSALLYTWWKRYCPWDRRLSNCPALPPNLGSGACWDPPTDVTALNVSLLLAIHSHEKHLSVAQEALFSRFKQSAAIKKESQSPEISRARYLLASAAKFPLVAWIFLIKDPMPTGCQRLRDCAPDKMRGTKEGWVIRREPTPQCSSQLDLTSVG